MPRKRSPVAIAAGKVILSIQEELEVVGGDSDPVLAQRVIYRARTMLRAAQSASVSSLLDGRSVAEYLDPVWVEKHPAVKQSIAVLVAAMSTHEDV